MIFGMVTKDGAGNVEFDTTISTWRIILSVVVSFPVGTTIRTQQFSVPGCNPSNSVAFALPMNNETGEAQANRQLETQMGDGIAYVRNYLAGRTDSVSFATMRFMVARWK